MSARPRTSSAARNAGVSRRLRRLRLARISPCSLTSQDFNRAAKIAAFAEMGYKSLAAQPIDWAAVAPLT
jgi:hypothetical protein